MSLCNDNNFNLFGNRQLPLFPAFIKPEPSELFSSWVVRLAHEHYMKVHTFTAFNFPDKQFWNRDIDRSVTDDLINQLALRNNCSFDTAYQTSLRSYEGLLFERHNEKTTSKWIMPLGIYHRTWKHKGLMYCSECLKKDKEKPYYRKQWRLSLSVVCIECKCFLRDCCINCGAPVSFFRSELGHKLKDPSNSIGCCYNCGFDLSKSKYLPADDEILNIQKQIYSIIRYGYNQQIIYPLQFFEVLKYFLKIFTGNRTMSHSAQKEIAGLMNLNYNVPKGGYNCRFDTLSIYDRSTALRMAFWLLEDWPVRFIEFFKSISCYSSDLFRDFENIPFWYWSVVYENFHVNNLNRKFI